MKNSKALMDEAYNQIQEDRKRLKDVYDKFIDQITSVGEYAVAGQNLNKCLELLSKQSSQLLEIAKLANSLKDDAGNLALSSEENDEIYDNIESRM